MKDKRNRMGDYAYEYFGSSRTYRELDEKITSAAKALWYLGVRENDVISLCLLTVPEFIHILYAANRIGAVCNFIAVNATDEIIISQLNNTESKVLIGMDFLYGKISCLLSKTGVTSSVWISLKDSMPLKIALLYGIKQGKVEIPDSKYWKKVVKKSENIKLKFAEANDEKPAVIEYTSGTTGEPKGALHTNHSANAVAFNYSHMDGMLDFKQNDSFFSILPPFYAYGVFFGVHMPLCLGLKVILSPDPSPENFGKQLLKCKANHFSAGPLHIENLITCLEKTGKRIPYLKTVAFGGDNVSKEWEQDKDSFLKNRGASYGMMQGYGMTEMAGSFGTYTHKYQFLLPFCKNNIKVIDPDTGKELKYGEEGEICLSGPSMMNCYYKKEQETNETIWIEDGERWLHSGDLGYVLENGQFVISGRMKRIYWAVGENSICRVYPMRIESVISEHQAVGKCAVVGVKNGDKGYKSIAFIIKNNYISERELREDLFKLCEERLEDTSRPCQYIFLDNLPATKAGKVDYKALENFSF